MLLEIAIADAYGLGFEFVPHTDDRPNDLTRYHQHPKYATLHPGHYSDDTQRAIANALVVLEGNPFDAMDYIRSYIHVFRRDPRDGYSRKYQAFLESVIAYSDVDEVAAEFFNQKVIRQAGSNGSIMGVAPLGYLHDPREVALAAAIQAMTTHSVETVLYAQMVALTAHWAIYGLGHDIDQFVLDHVSSDEIPCWRTPGNAPRTNMSAKDTWKMVRRAFDQKHQSLAGLLRWCVEGGGDTDSISAIAVGIGSCLRLHERDLPQVLVDGLENGKFGRTYLEKLDTRLVWHSRNRL